MSLKKVPASLSRLTAEEAPQSSQTASLLERADCEGAPTSAVCSSVHASDIISAADKLAIVRELATSMSVLTGRPLQETLGVR